MLGDIHERLESLKHLGGSYSPGAYLNTYSCDVEVKNYTSMLNSTRRTWNTTVSWNEGEGNLRAALKWKLGDDMRWSIRYTGSNGKLYDFWRLPEGEFDSDSFRTLQERVQADLWLGSERKLYVYFTFYG
jgi:hypothetical protein